jgi:hypothetical protein
MRLTKSLGDDFLKYFSDKQIKGVTLKVKAGESMADPNVVRALRATRCEFSKRGIEITRADIRLVHGGLHIGGTISKMRGSAITDLKAEVELVAKVLRQKSDIKTVTVDCRYME